MSRIVSNIVSRRFQKIRVIRAICEKKLSEDFSEKTSLRKTQREKQQIVP